MARNASKSIAYLLALLLASHSAFGQAMYKYRGADGEWIFTDRKPPDEMQAEVRAMEASFSAPRFLVTHTVNERRVRFVAKNEFHAPIQIRLTFREIDGMAYPHPDDRLVWVVPARREETLLDLGVLEDAGELYVDYGYEYLPGDPSAQHSIDEPYQAPFSAGADYRVTQAYPDALTHNTIDSAHAVDIAMPIGTDVMAARGGIVFDVAADHYSGGLDFRKNSNEANIVRILHDDGTFSTYAHLNWNSIRVKPGDRVRTGQYIADSGNTGFSSGPHLHFSVQRNTDMQVHAVPIEFKGAASQPIVPATGNVLTGYP